MEKKLREQLLSAKTLPDFRAIIRNFCQKEARDGAWVDIDKIFTERQVRYKEKMVSELKRIVDIDFLWPKRSLSFNNDYSKFKVLVRWK